MNAASRPIQTTRAWYETTRRKSREQAGPREDRGLPHHPDGSGLADCPNCKGSGLVDVPHWHPDEREAWCDDCTGSGIIADGYRDPLLRLRHYRQRRMRQHNPVVYQYLRKLAMVPCWQLRLIESAVGCELAARDAVQAWRSVA